MFFFFVVIFRNNCGECLEELQSATSKISSHRINRFHSQTVLTKIHRIELIKSYIFREFHSHLDPGSTFKPKERPVSSNGPPVIFDSLVSVPAFSYCSRFLNWNMEYQNIENWFGIYLWKIFFTASFNLVRFEELLYCVSTLTFKSYFNYKTFSVILSSF